MLSTNQSAIGATIGRQRDVGDAVPYNALSKIPAPPVGRDDLIPPPISVGTTINAVGAAPRPAPT